MKEKMYERILAWLDGTMKAEERRIFEKEMREDKQLATEVELVESAIAALKETEVIAMREQLTKIMESEALPGKKGRGNGSRLVLALVVLAGLALLFFLFLKEKEDQPPKRLGPVAAYEKYFSASDGLLQLNIGDSKRTETEEDSLEIQIRQMVRQLNEQFAAKDPSAALKTLTSLKSTDPSNKFLSKTELLLFEGVLQLKRGKAEAAIVLFDSVEQIRSNEEAQWYSAGALLSLGRKKEAVSQLESIIAQPDNPKKRDATELLQNLGPTTSSELFIAYFEPPARLNASPGTERNGDAVTQPKRNPGLDLLAKVEALYKAQKYQEALSVLRAAPPQFANDFKSDVNYQMGVLLLLTNQPEEAITHFSEVVTTHQDQRDWYIAMALLKLGNRPVDAKAAFEKIAGSKSPWRKKAKEILEKLTK